MKKVRGNAPTTNEPFYALLQRPLECVHCFIRGLHLKGPCIRISGEEFNLESVLLLSKWMNVFFTLIVVATTPSVSLFGVSAQAVDASSDSMSVSFDPMRTF